MFSVILFFFFLQGIADKLVLLDFSEGTKGGMMDLDIFNLPNVEISKGLAVLLQRFVPCLPLYLSQFFCRLYFLGQFQVQGAIVQKVQWFSVHLLPCTCIGSTWSTSPT